MRTLFSVTNVVVNTITSPSELQRGELAFFSTSGKLVAADASNIEDGSPIIAYCGLGDGAYKVGATIFRDSIDRSKLEYAPSKPSSFTATEVTVGLEGEHRFSLYYKDPYLSTAYPRTRDVVMDYRVTMDKVEWMKQFAAKVVRELDLLVASYPSVTYTVTPSTDKLTIEITAPANVELSAALYSFSADGVFTAGTPEVGGGKEIAALEKHFAVHRGRNPETMPIEAQVPSEYFTTDPSKGYNIWTLTSLTHREKSIVPEDANGYIIEQHIAIDTMATAAKDVMDILFNSL